MVEKCVYTTAHESPKIHMEELPPIIAMAMRGAVVYNTEKDKKSSFLESDHVTEGIIK